MHISKVFICYSAIEYEKLGLWAVITENVHQVCKNIWFLCVCMLCFHVFFASTFAQMYPSIWYQTCTSSEHSKIEFNFKRYRYVSYVKSETSDIWRTGAWFLKSFGGRVEEKHIYHLAKLNSAVKTGTVCRGCNVTYEVFWKMQKLTLRAELET